MDNGGNCSGAIVSPTQVLTAVHCARAGEQIVEGDSYHEGLSGFIKRVISADIMRRDLYEAEGGECLNLRGGWCAQADMALLTLESAIPEGYLALPIHFNGEKFFKESVKLVEFTLKSAVNLLFGSHCR